MAVGDRLAVMRRGVVEQIGSSDELYNCPGYAFVANFIGKMNFLKAELLGTGVGPAGGTARARIAISGIEVEVDAGRVHLSPETKAGANILVGCRPEQMSIAPIGESHNATPDMAGAGHPLGLIQGRVNIIQHLGQFVRYDVGVDAAISPQAFEIDMPGLVRGLSEGDRVTVSLKPGLASLYLPDEGRPE